MAKKVLTGAERKAQLLEAGAKLASKHGAANVTRRMVATACKCAEGLVTNYMGDAKSAQKAYARKAKAMGLSLPDKAKTDAIGVKLRKHKPKDARDTRRRSIREVQAIKRKVTRSAGSGKFVKASEAKRDPGGTVTERVRQSPAKPRTSPARGTPSPVKPQPSPSAARAPKAPPTDPVPMPDNLTGSFP